MERRNNGTGRVQLPEPKRMDTRKHTRKETTRPNNRQGHLISICVVYEYVGTYIIYMCICMYINTTCIVLLHIYILIYDNADIDKN